MRYTVTVEVDVSAYDDYEYVNDTDVACALKAYFSSQRHNTVLSEDWDMQVTWLAVTQVEWPDHQLTVLRRV